MAKTGAGLAQWAESVYRGGKHVYWWGTYCKPCTDELLAGKTKQYPDHYKESRQPIYRHHIQAGKIATDCIGLIKGYYWEKDGVIKYKRDDLPDRSSSGIYRAATIKGKLETMPEIPGLLLWTKNQDHVAVYVGGGYEVEARGFVYGIQRNKVSSRNFTHWGLCPYIEYTAEEIAKAKAAAGITESVSSSSNASSTSTQAPASKPETTAQAQGGVEMPTIRKGMKGTAVRILQRMLLANGCTLPRYGVDGDAGAETIAAVKAFQTTHSLSVDGVAGPLTWAALAG